MTQLALCLVPGPLTLMGLPFYLPAIPVSPIYTFNVAGWHLKADEFSYCKVEDYSTDILKEGEIGTFKSIRFT